MPHTSFLTESEVEDLGLGSRGRTVLISRFASIHHPERIHVGSHVRIDDFVVLTTGNAGRIEAHSVVLPGVCIGEGVAVGALSLVDRSLEAWGSYAGSPAKFLRPRSQALLSLEQKHRAATGESVDAAGD